MSQLLPSRALRIPALLVLALVGACAGPGPDLASGVSTPGTSGGSVLVPLVSQQRGVRVSPAVPAGAATVLGYRSTGGGSVELTEYLIDPLAGVRASSPVSVLAPEGQSWVEFGDGRVTLVRWSGIDAAAVEDVLEAVRAENPRQLEAIGLVANTMGGTSSDCVAMRVEVDFLDDRTGERLNLIQRVECQAEGLGPPESASGSPVDVRDTEGIYADGALSWRENSTAARLSGNGGLEASGLRRAADRLKIVQVSGPAQLLEDHLLSADSGVTGGLSWWEEDTGDLVLLEKDRALYLDPAETGVYVWGAGGNAHILVSGMPDAENVEVCLPGCVSIGVEQVGGSRSRSIGIATVLGPIEVVPSEVEIEGDSRSVQLLG